MASKATDEPARVMVGFDWHDTLFRLYPHHFLAPINKVRAAFGRKALNDLSESKSVIDSLAEAVENDHEEISPSSEKAILKRYKLNKALEIYKANYYQNVISHCGILPGVIATLDELKARGIPVFIISNHMQDLLVHDVRKLGLSHYFSHIIGTTDPTEFKPRNKMFNRLLNSIHSQGWYSTDTIYYVGDQISDIKASKNSGCKSVLVSDKHQYLDPLPDYWITDMIQLVKIIPINRTKCSRTL